MDALDLHDSDSSGSDLQKEGLDLDDLEEDAIPDDPLVQMNNIIEFEFIGKHQSLKLTDAMREQHAKAIESMLK